MKNLTGSLLLYNIYSTLPRSVHLKEHSTDQRRKCRRRETHTHTHLMSDETHTLCQQQHSLVSWPAPAFNNTQKTNKTMTTVTLHPPPNPCQRKASWKNPLTALVDAPADEHFIHYQSNDYTHLWRDKSSKLLHYINEYMGIIQSRLSF